MVSMGASYGHLHIQQEHYRQKMRRKEEEKKAMEEQQQTKKKKKKKMMKGGCNASVHPKGLSESQAKGMAGLHRPRPLLAYPPRTRSGVREAIEEER
ncbi:hypothetical protein OPV22_025548 [Ensete ventricosum]|uniref:Uncharacterized protein n=1 Tax=Ensete ventricosum TaxID=4639 RepID=A0AAV8QA60_ENSVE|nr:hypothetical protein OPV22_025548 [Ensete ventricosum]